MPRADTQITCRPADSEAEIRACAQIRQAVFVSEQGLFDADDHDEYDDDPATIHIVGLIDSELAGTVRIYRLDEPGLWKGDRLAVRPELRHSGAALGKRLVRCAVATAGELGGTEMLASIQMPNVVFFEHLGWKTDGDPAPYHGVDHQMMRIGLSGGLPT